MPTYTTAPNGLRMVNGMYSMNTRRGMQMRMIGTQQVLQNLNKAIAGIHGATMAGLIKVGMFIKEDMDSTPPLIPVSKRIAGKDYALLHMRDRYQIVPVPPKELGNGQLSKQFGVLLGWPNKEGEYAPYVHEMTQPPYEHPIDWTRSGSGPKFFEAALKRNTQEIVNIVKQNVQTQTGI